MLEVKYIENTASHHWGTVIDILPVTFCVIFQDWWVQTVSSWTVEWDSYEAGSQIA